MAVDGSNSKALLRQLCLSSKDNVGSCLETKSVRAAYPLPILNWRFDPTSPRSSYNIPSATEAEFKPVCPLANIKVPDVNLQSWRPHWLLGSRSPVTSPNVCSQTRKIETWKQPRKRKSLVHYIQFNALRLLDGLKRQTLRQEEMSPANKSRDRSRMFTWKRLPSSSVLWNFDILVWSRVAAFNETSLESGQAEKEYSNCMKQLAPKKHSFNLSSIRPSGSIMIQVISNYESQYSILLSVLTETRSIDDNVPGSGHQNLKF